MTKKLTVLSIVFAIALYACNHNPGGSWDGTSGQLPKMEIKIRRYGKALFELDTTRFQEGLKNLQREFPQFLNGNLDDSSNIRKLLQFVSDTQLIALYHETTKVYPDLKEKEQTIGEAFAHIRYYFPEFSAPQVYTYVSGIQFDAPVLTADNSLVIALDCYLGEDQSRYKSAGIPVYQLRRMTAEHLEADVLKAIYAVYFEQPFPVQTILDEMIHTGIRYAFIEAMLPNTPEHILLGYSKSQFEWLKENEASVWRSIVSEELLYKSDQQLLRKFFGDGPFTQEFSTDAPPRIGDYIGWHIVRQYIKQTAVKNPEDLLHISDAQGVLAKSRYKPR